MDGTITDTGKQQLIETVALFATTQSANAVRPLLGCKDKYEIDRIGTRALRVALNSSEVVSTCVSCEGLRDSCNEDARLIPMEILGSGDFQTYFISDPVEGTNLVAEDKLGACSVIAFSEEGRLPTVTDTYAEKIVFGVAEGEHSIEPDFPLEKKLTMLAVLKDKYVQDLRVVCLDRKRHAKALKTMRRMGVKVTLISDGDLMPGVLTVLDGMSSVDAVYGIGGAPEGLLSAAAVSGRGTIHIRFLAKEMLEVDEDRLKVGDDVDDLLREQNIIPGEWYTGKNLVPSWSVFAASSISEGSLFHPHLDRAHPKMTSIIVTSGGNFEPKITWE